MRLSNLDNPIAPLMRGISVTTERIASEEEICRSHRKKQRNTGRHVHNEGTWRKLLCSNITSKVGNKVDARFHLCRQAMCAFFAYKIDMGKFRAKEQSAGHYSRQL